MSRSGRLPLEQLAPYLLAVPETPTTLSFRQVFGNDRPIEMEVGFGKGLFLLTSALARPETNFLGIEIARKYQLFTATRMAKRSLGNVRLACGDARLFLHNHVAAGSVRAVHVYFPDPWWKQRHQKRRLFTEEFAVQVERVLETGGRLHLVTDVCDYFEVMTKLLAEKTHLRCLPPPQPGEPAHDLDYLTNFERKFRKEGRPVYRAVYAKASPPVR